MTQRKIKKVKAWVKISCETLRIMEVYIDEHEAVKNEGTCDGIIPCEITYKI